MRRIITTIILTTFVLAATVGFFVIATVAVALASGFMAEVAALGALGIILQSIVGAFAWALYVLDPFTWIELIWQWLKLLGLR